MSSKDMERQLKLDRYMKAAHAMQSGVAYTMTQDPKDCEPKHLRVGINSAHVSDLAIAKLLMMKGVFTEEEYLESLACEMEREAQRYEAEIGNGIKLG